HDDYVMARRGWRASEDFAVADLMADVVVFALDGRRFGILCLRQQRKINWASGGYAAGYDEFNEVPAICAHEGFLCNSAALGRRYDFTSSAAISTLPSALARSRYQVMIAANEKTKMILEMALISGVMPRRKRPQISRGSVLSRPIRKKLTAISSIDSVKINSAAPIIESRKLGRVTRQKVCQ